MTYANIDLTVKDIDSSYTVTIDEDVRPLAEAVAVKYPQWTLVSANYRYGGNNNVIIRQFKVLDSKREELGRIGTTYYNRSYSYEITNHRIANARERGSSAVTKDLKKAMRHISKNFGSKSLMEKMNEASSKAQELGRQLTNRREWEFKNGYNSVANGLMGYVMEHIDELEPHIQKPSTAVASLKDSYSKMLCYQSITNNSNRMVVLIEGSSYIVKGSGAVRILEQEKLPEFMRRNIGMLKLMEKEQALENIGCRIDENVFLIVPPENYYVDTLEGVTNESAA